MGRYVFRTNFSLKTWDGHSAKSLSSADLFYLLKHPERVRYAYEDTKEWEDMKPLHETPLWAEMLVESMVRADEYFEHNPLAKFS